MTNKKTAKKNASKKSVAANRKPTHNLPVAYKTGNEEKRFRVGFVVPPLESKIHIVKKGENPFRGEARKAQFSKVRNGMTVEQFKLAVEKAKLGFDNRLLALAATKYGIIRLTA